MNVKELKERLKNIDEDILVIVPGYEGGYDEVKEAKLVLTKLNVRSDDPYQGPHEIKDSNHDKWYEEYNGIECMTFLIY